MKFKIHENFFSVLIFCFVSGLAGIITHDIFSPPGFNIVHFTHDSVTIKEQYYWGLVSNRQRTLYILRFKRHNHNVIEYVSRNGKLYEYSHELKEFVYSQREQMDRIERTRALLRNRAISARN